MKYLRPFVLASLAVMSLAFVSARPGTFEPRLAERGPAEPRLAEPLLITWKDLTDVRFKKKWNDDIGMYFLYPTFGPAVKNLEGKKVILRGYMIPMTADGEMLVISQQPMAMCFFCGGSGPESIAQVKLSKPHRFKVDQVATIQGTLRLNATNIDELNYILDQASVLQ
ncbi:hypothetical protein GCM10027275_20120 [Rhabdobacter roseus]|uniref:DUF3299 domain-containing protein n=1 Tax=Rhabdobacter roseus TaxID=1655419 RepID=A0A840TRS7_9BACT|nr:DUF3299 domain-containing protein [Rhabdobacter roseus]MBB5283943.1 hypothetical protein [Rhabdobacter roseus]